MQMIRMSKAMFSTEFQQIAMVVFYDRSRMNVLARKFFVLAPFWLVRKTQRRVELLTIENGPCFLQCRLQIASLSTADLPCSSNGEAVESLKFKHSSGLDWHESNGTVVKDFKMHKAINCTQINEGIEWIEGSAWNQEWRRNISVLAFRPDPFDEDIYRPSEFLPV